MSDKERYIVFVDLDKTLLISNSGKALVLAAYKNGLLTRRTLIKAFLLSLFFKAGVISSEQISWRMVTWLRGVSESAVEALAGQVVETDLLPMLRPAMIRDIEQHRRRGARIVLLSAAVPYICRPLAGHLKLDDVICSAMETQEGIFTGKTDGAICMEEEKEHRLRQYCRDNTYDLQSAYCYGDSYDDRFALAAVGNPVCVDPDKKLRRLCSINGWSVMT
jgi:HAD superfamily hydrolase (TIGR01490 family)